MWRLHRYYFKEVLISATLTLTVLFGVVTVSMIYRGIDRAQGGELIDAFIITVLWTADAFPHLLAIALLFGTISTFARASSEREVTAIKAAGISLLAPMAAAALVGIMASLLAAACVHYVIPWAHFHKYRVVAEAIRGVILNTRVAGDQINLKDYGVMTWAREDTQHRFHDVVIFRGGQVVVADETWFEAEAEFVSLRLRGSRSPLAGMAIEAPSFTMDTRELAEDTLRHEGDRDLTSDQLLAEVVRGVHENPDGAHFTVHRRTCFALLPCLLVPLGFCIGVLSRERGRAAAMSIGLIPVVIYYACDFLSLELVRVLDWPPTAYLPASVLIAGGIPFCWKTLRS